MVKTSNLLNKDATILMISDPPAAQMNVNGVAAGIAQIAALSLK